MLLSAKIFGLIYNLKLSILKCISLIEKYSFLLKNLILKPNLTTIPPEAEKYRNIYQTISIFEKKI
jgi:hypothetical protein